MRGERDESAWQVTQYTIVMLAIAWFGSYAMTTFARIAVDLAVVFCFTLAPFFAAMLGKWVCWALSLRRSIDSVVSSFAS